MFWTFWPANVLRATAACIFLTSNLQKVVRTRQFFHILTCKCASRHSGVPFSRIATSKMGPALRCFVHFDLQMCFAPQRRAIFGHRNFKKCSDTVSFLAFSLPHVLFATAACHFSPVCWTATSAPAALASLLFEHQEARFIEKTRRFRDVPNISRTCTCFLVTLHACWSSFCWLDISTLLDTSTLLFNSAYCRKLDF